MPYRQKQRKRGRKRNPGAMAKLASAALLVTKDDLRLYEPDELDIAIAQGFLAGHISVPEISEFCSRAECTVRKRLQNPTSFAWIAQQVSSLIHTRIGQVDAALLRKAVQGHVEAIKLFYQRFGKLADLKIVAHGNLGDLSNYSDADLDAAIQSAVKQDPNLQPPPSSPESSTVIDVTPQEEQVCEENSTSPTQ